LFLTFLLGLSGAFLIGMVWKNRWVQHQSFSPRKISLITVCWFMIGVIPSFFKYPLQVMVLVVFIGAFIHLFLQLLQKITLKERRIEQLTLKILFPLYTFYLALLTYWATHPTSGRIHENFQEFAFNKRIELIFLMVELVASYTLLGYMIAGMRGRKEGWQGYTFGLVFLITLSTAIVTDVMSASSSLAGINIPRIILVTSMSLYGTIIYSLQLNAIQRLRKVSRRNCNHNGIGTDREEVGRPTT